MKKKNKSLFKQGGVYKKLPQLNPDLTICAGCDRLMPVGEIYCRFVEKGHIDDIDPDGIDLCGDCLVNKTKLE